MTGLTPTLTGWCRRAALTCLLMAAGAAACAAPIQQQTQQQDLGELKQAAMQFLKQLAPPANAEVSITLGEIDSRLNLGRCDRLTPFLPQGSKSWGKISLGIRCSEPVNWTVFLPANVKVSTDYYVTSHSISAGQILGMEDLSKTSGDISQLPVGTVLNPEQAIGKTLRVGLAAGGVLRTDMLKSPLIIQQGQTVKVIIGGPGFQVSTEAQSLSNASEGQVVRAKTQAGQTISGIAREAGVVEIAYQ